MINNANINAYFIVYVGRIQTHLLITVGYIRNYVICIELWKKMEIIRIRDIKLTLRLTIHSCCFYFVQDSLN